MFEDRTQEAIKRETLALINSATGLSSMAGSYADATIGPVAGAISELYKALPAVVSMLFIDETSGGFIDLVGETYFDIKRRPGTRARCAITLTGDPGTDIPAGTAFLTSTGLRFVLVDPVSIPSSGSAQGTLEAAQEGSAYNIGAGAIVSMYVNLPGLASYSNEEAAGGTDTESDEALYQRIRERRQKPINGANGWQYRAWALEVAGVGDAKVVELANGPGTVGVMVVDSNLEPASPEIVSACQAYLGNMRPVGATVSVEAPEAVEVDVSATVVISSYTTPQIVEEEMTRRLRSYLESVIRDKYSVVHYDPADDKAYPVIYNRLLALLLTIDGVINATTMTVNGGTQDLELQPDQAPTVGKVEVKSNNGPI